MLDFVACRKGSLLVGKSPIFIEEGVDVDIVGIQIKRERLELRRSRLKGYFATRIMFKKIAMAIDEFDCLAMRRIAIFFLYSHPNYRSFIHVFSMRANCSSVSTGMLSSFAFSNFEPAFSPAT